MFFELCRLVASALQRHDRPKTPFAFSAADFHDVGLKFGGICV